MNEMHGNYPWSESGKQLLSLIKKTIIENGGRMRVAHEIVEYNPGLFDIQTKRYLKKRAYSADRYICKGKIKPRFYTDDDKEYIMKHYGTIPTSRLANILGRTRDGIKMYFYRNATPERISELPELTNGSKYGKR